MTASLSPVQTPPPARAEIIRQMAAAMPPLSGETRARLRPLLSGTIPAPADTASAA